VIIDKETGTISLYEFIYTYRESVDSPFPKMTSNEAINALKMLKELKTEVSSG